MVKSTAFKPKRISTYKIGDYTITLFDHTSHFTIVSERKGSAFLDFFAKRTGIDAAAEEFADRVQILLKEQLHEMWK
jgi:hypothetical protein